MVAQSNGKEYPSIVSIIDRKLFIMELQLDVGVYHLLQNNNVSAYNLLENKNVKFYFDI